MNDAPSGWALWSQSAITLTNFKMYGAYCFGPEAILILEYASLIAEKPAARKKIKENALMSIFVTNLDK